MKIARRLKRRVAPKIKNSVPEGRLKPLHERYYLRKTQISFSAVPAFSPSASLTRDGVQTSRRFL